MVNINTNEVPGTMVESQKLKKDGYVTMTALL